MSFMGIGLSASVERSFWPRIFSPPPAKHCVTYAAVHRDTPPSYARDKKNRIMLRGVERSYSFESPCLSATANGPGRREERLPNPRSSNRTVYVSAGCWK